MATWEYISKRRGYVLEDLVKDAGTLEQAINIFRDKDIPLPQDGSLEAIFSEKSANRQKTFNLEKKPAAKKATDKKDTAKKPIAKKKKAEGEAVEAIVDAEEVVPEDEQKKSDKGWGIVNSKRTVA